jgi:glucosamine kinase
LTGVPDLVVGIDAGGTTTRCLVLTGEGAVAGHGRAAGANLRSNAGSVEAPLTAALADALAGLAPADVRAGVFGIAGAGAAGAEVVGAAAGAAWRAVGLAGRPQVVTDLDVAFAAGTPSADGLLLLAGTGAAAAAFTGRRMVRRCDGYGWLLGDQGSAVWLGLAGIRAALDARDGRGPATRLLADVGARVGARPDDDLPQLLIARMHADVPARLGSFAPLVTSAAAGGDAVAVALVEAAADLLVAAVDAVAAEPTAAELVLAGGLLAAGPVRAAVRARLAGRGGLQVSDAGPGAAGAAVLALAELAGGAVTAAQHAAVLRAAAAVDAFG